MLIMWTLVIVVGFIGYTSRKTKEVYRKAVPYSGKKLEQIQSDEYYKLHDKAVKTYDWFYDYKNQENEYKSQDDFKQVIICRNCKIFRDGPKAGQFKMNFIRHVENHDKEFCSLKNFGQCPKCAKNWQHDTVNKLREKYLNQLRVGIPMWERTTLEKIFTSFLHTCNPSKNSIVFIHTKKEYLEDSSLNVGLIEPIFDENKQIGFKFYTSSYKELLSGKPVLKFITEKKTNGKQSDESSIFINDAD